MKHNWEYKKFGSLCNIVRGGSPRPIQDYLTDSEDGLNWIKIGDVAAGSKYITSTKEKIKKDGLAKTRQVFKGDFILSNSMSFGRPYILKIDGCIHDGWLAIKNVDNHFIPDFLYYYLSSPTTYAIFKKLVKGGVVSNLNSDIVKGIYVPVPTMEVQKQIVVELDKINEVINDCRELLRHLDALAQSLFYNYFGDPLSNPKGWTVRPLKEVVIDKLSYGSGASGIPFDNSVRYIRITDIDDNGNLKPEIATSPSAYESKYDLVNGDILFARSGATVGKSFLYKESIGKAIYAGYLIKARVNTKLILPNYLYALTKTKYYLDYIRDSIRGAAQPNVNAQLYGAFQLPVPPLSLQEKFASRIEQIDAQKKTVEETMENLQTLLNSRMDYWFN